MPILPFAVHDLNDLLQLRSSEGLGHSPVVGTVHALKSNIMLEQETGY